jgi:tetratricopeptide (TPR) repeat protein
MSGRIVRFLTIASAILCCMASASTAAVPAGSEQGRPSGRVGKLIEVSETVRRAGRPADALHILELAEPMVAEEATSIERARLRLQRARCNYYRTSLAGEPQDANIAELKALLMEAETLKSAWLLADVRDQLGLAIYSRDFGKNDMDEPRRLFEQALDTRRKTGDVRGVAESLFHLGLTFEHKKDPSPEELRRAVASHEEALSIAEDRGFDVEASYAVRHLAYHRKDAGDLDAALTGFERSLMLRIRAGYQINLAPSLISIGEVWQDKGDVAKAREHYQRALAEANRLGARRFQDRARDALESLAAGSPSR